jgi:hypothetical protein
MYVRTQTDLCIYTYIRIYNVIYIYTDMQDQIHFTYLENPLVSGLPSVAPRYGVVHGVGGGEAATPGGPGDAGAGSDDGRRQKHRDSAEAMAMTGDDGRCGCDKM